MRVRASIRPAAAWAVAGVVLVLAATGITLAVGSGGGSQAVNAAPAAESTAAVCEQIVVPAYFAKGYWVTAIHSEHPPADMILDISGTGAGSAPDPEFQTLVKQAQAAGITILGYSSTVDGARPVAQVEADVRNYRAWYGITSIFLDRVSGLPAQLSYYGQLYRYIHQLDAGAQVWLNPGDYPDQSYMSVGDEVMVFEGTYAQYVNATVPSWVGSYSADRFINTIYATPGSALGTALLLARQRNAGHVYVTDLVGSNPYQGLPSYWATEDVDASAACRGSG